MTNGKGITPETDERINCDRVVNHHLTFFMFNIYENTRRMAPETDTSLLTALVCIYIYFSLFPWSLLGKSQAYGKPAFGQSKLRYIVSVTY